MGVGTYDKNGGFFVLFNGSGRLKFEITKNIPNSNSYVIESFNINTHNIFGTFMVAIFAPYLLPGLMSGVKGLVSGN